MSRSPVPPPPHAAAAQPAGQPTSNASHQATASVAPSVRAQLLTTEHWSLLATRSTTQSEVLSRITTYNHLQGAKPVLQPLASSGMFIAWVACPPGHQLDVGLVPRAHPEHRLVCPNLSNDDDGKEPGQPTFASTPATCRSRNGRSILTTLDQQPKTLAPTFAFVDPFGFSGPQTTSALDPGQILDPHALGRDIIQHRNLLSGLAQRR